MGTRRLQDKFVFVHVGELYDWIMTIERHEASRVAQAIRRIIDEHEQRLEAREDDTQ
jgi:hypothetical protein